MGGALRLVTLERIKPGLKFGLIDFPAMCRASSMRVSALVIERRSGRSESMLVESCGLSAKSGPRIQTEVGL